MLSHIIAPMKAEDAQETAELLDRVVSSLDYYNERARREELAKYTKTQLLQIIQEEPDAVLVARWSGKIVGFCISYYDDGLIWLSWFGVDDACRGQGVGRTLLEALEATAGRRHAHKIWCDTRVPNEKSARVLVAAGFQRLTMLKNHWYGQDFYLWEKPLAQ